jgi:hypothetical protein
VTVLEEQSAREPQVRAAGASSTAQKEALTPCLVEEADFIGHLDPGLPPDDLTARGREVVEGVQGFQPQKFRSAKSKERPTSGDRSFNPCLTAQAHTTVYTRTTRGPELLIPLIRDY